MDIVILLSLTLVIFTWPLWFLSLAKMFNKKKPTKTGTEIMIMNDIDIRTNRKPIAKETCIWEERRIIRKRSIYAKP